MDKQLKISNVSFSNIQLGDAMWGFYENGFDVSHIITEIDIGSTNAEDEEFFIKKIKEENCDLVFSYDFCPALSSACQKIGLAYISWVYDSPHYTLYTEQVKNDCNYIFSFDHCQIENVKKLGVKHIYYHPMATNISRTAGLYISPEDEKKYTCDISFVGDLHIKFISYYAVDPLVKESTKKEYQDIIKQNYGKWDGENHIFDKLSKEALLDLKSTYNKSVDDILVQDEDWFLDELFSSRVVCAFLAMRERLEMIARSAKYDVKFYTREGVTIEGVDICPPVSYLEEMPKVFYLSRINLNSTSRGIRAGIPLRIFDIMGSGGFVLTNYQRELDDHFTVGKDLEVFHDFKEYDEKVAYYLSHEDERLRIAINGYKTVKEKYSYTIQVKRMIDILKNEGVL